ncbi:unnamed protein product [Natator depressus]
MALEFFWPGLHWVSAGVLSLPLEEGGHGLVCLRSQVHVFCLQALQRLLYGAGSLAWSTLAHAFLRCLRGLRYDRQLFFFIQEVFHKTSPSCWSSTRTSSGPGSFFQQPGPLWSPRGRTSSRSPCCIISIYVCRWWSLPQCVGGCSWQKPPESEVQYIPPLPPLVTESPGDALELLPTKPGRTLVKSPSCEQTLFRASSSHGFHLPGSDLGAFSILCPSMRFPQRVSPGGAPGETRGSCTPTPQSDGTLSQPVKQRFIRRQEHGLKQSL